MKSAATLLLIATVAATPQSAAAWGDTGHRVVALVAEHYLTPSAKQQVEALLAADSDSLTQHDIASEATWADKYRDSNNRRDYYDATKRWHFIDLEIDDPDFDTACYGRQPLPADTPASVSDKNACVVDKITQFAQELGAPGTDAEERLYALKFLLHLVGDMHQPLHASDHNDNGGNGVKVTVAGFDQRSRDTLHGFWDTQFVEMLGRPSSALANQLLAQITPEQEATWKEGTPDDWAMESFSLAQEVVYGDPALSGSVDLDAAYVQRAESAVALQLSRAGIRLAAVLNKALDPPVAEH